MLMIVRALGLAVNVLLVTCWWTVLLYPRFCGPSILGHKFSLLDDGEEFCAKYRPSKCGHCFGGLIFATSS